MKKFTKYPELDKWFNEGLFVRRMFKGERFSVANQLWYVNRLRSQYFDPDAFKSVWNFGKGKGGDKTPYLERRGWMSASIRLGFNNITNPEMRNIVTAMILCEQTPLPSAREAAHCLGWAWEQFRFDFAFALFEMYKKKVGVHV